MRSIEDIRCSDLSRGMAHHEFWGDIPILEQIHQCHLKGGAHGLTIFWLVYSGFGLSPLELVWEASSDNVYANTRGYTYPGGSIDILLSTSIHLLLLYFSRKQDTPATTHGPLHTTALLASVCQRALGDQMMGIKLTPEKTSAIFGEESDRYAGANLSGNPPQSSEACATTNVLHGKWVRRLPRVCAKLLKYCGLS